MNRLLTACIVMLCTALPAFATNFPITAGASTATISSTIATAAGTSGTNTVTFAAGSYSITSKITIPCPLGTLTIQGPTVAYPGPYTANLNGSVVGNPGFTENVCTNAVTIQYFNWDGGQPSAGGGGFIDTPGGVSNLTIQFNYLHGNWGNFNTSHDYDGLIYLDGPQAPTPADTNVTIQWNILGDGVSDCNPIMNNFNYQGGNAYAEGPGNCNAIGVHVSTTNLLIQYNNMSHLEQGMKFYSGSGTPGSASQQILAKNLNVVYNWFHLIHRMNLEAQQIANPLFNVSSNLVDVPYDPAYSSDGFSIPMCCSAYYGIPGPNNVDCNNNTLISNPTGLTPGGSSGPYTVEWWSSGTCGNNLVQGDWYNGISWGNGEPPWDSSLNICQNTRGALCLFHQVESTTIPPTSHGNTTTTTASQVTSPTPSISPTPSGTYSAPISVTISVPTTFNGGLGPQGPFTAFYTTDGSTPTTSSTLCNTWPATSCTISVAQGSTVSALAIWGTPNMPRSYTAPYGWKPSLVTSAHYVSSGGGTPTLSGVTFFLQGGGSTVQIGNSVQGCATLTYTGGTTTAVCGVGTDTLGTSVGTYTTSSSAVASVDATGHYAGLTAGSSNLTVKGGSITSGATAFPLTVSSTAPVLQTVASNCTDSIAVGQTGSCVLTCTYSPPQASVCPSATWTSSVPANATVGSTTGVLTGVAVGSTFINGSFGGQTTNAPGEPVTVTSATPPAATLVSAAVTFSPPSFLVGATGAALVTCTYSDGTTTNCTTVDGHGNDAASFTSSATGVATVNSTSGVATGISAGNTNIGSTVTGTATVVATPFSLAVTAPTSVQILGDNQFNLVGVTYPNAINSVYAVTPAGTTSTVSLCSFYLPTGSTYTAGSKWDCILTLAPTSTTQASSSLCHTTYTTLGTAADVGWHTLGITGCGTLTASTAYWVGTNTNESGPIGMGFWNCGSTCNGSVPTSGNGTYQCSFISASYGIYTGMGTAMTLGCGPGSGTNQASQYVTLTTPTPVLTGGYLTTPGSTSNLQVGSSLQFFGAACYSNGLCYLASPGPDQYGDTLSSIATSAPSVMTMGAIGGANPALATGITTGTATASGVITGPSGSKPTSIFVMNISLTPVALPPVSPPALKAR